MNSEPAQLVALLPYFGSLPTTFELTLASMRRNTCIDWVIVTDQPGIEASENVAVFKSTLALLRQEFSLALGFDVMLERPYKLCDFRPAYGELFAAFTNGYEYWGYCDADVVFGDLGRSIRPAIAANAGKIFQRGHLSFIRNDAYHSSIWRNAVSGEGAGYREVFSSPENFLFDEAGGFYHLLKSAKVDTYEPGDLFDIEPKSYRPRATSAPKSTRVVYAMRDGRIYEVLKADGSVLREGRYIHLQKRSYPRTLVPEVRAGQWGWSAPVEGETLVFGPASLGYCAWEDVSQVSDSISQSMGATWEWVAYNARRSLRALRRRVQTHVAVAA